VGRAGLYWDTTASGDVFLHSQTKSVMLQVDVSITNYRGSRAHCRERFCCGEISDVRKEEPCNSHPRVDCGAEEKCKPTSSGRNSTMLLRSHAAHASQLVFFNICNL
jgi:hypothetical protein